MERRVADLTDRARALEDRGGVVLGPGIRGATAATILDAATRAWSGYHTNAVLRPAQGGVVLGDTNLLLYYQNRLAPHGLAWDVLPGGGSAKPTAANAAAPALGGSR
jgi:glycerol-3-phosphate O-acyltransferase